MSSKEKELPLAPIGRILHEEGAERVSEDAARALREIVEIFAREAAREASKLARHANRKTVTREDIEFVARRMSRQSSLSIRI